MRCVYDNSLLCKNTTRLDQLLAYQGSHILAVFENVSGTNVLAKKKLVQTFYQNRQTENVPIFFTFKKAKQILIYSNSALIHVYAKLETRFQIVSEI